VTISTNVNNDTISLYDYEDEDQAKKRMTWEEWYLKKKIDSLKNEKTMKRRMQAKWDEDQKAGNRKNYTEEEKNKFLMEWMNKKKKQRIECERKLKILLEEKKGKVKLKLWCLWCF
jgi:hypothetical protein